MASKNKLVGSGKIEEEKVIEEKKVQSEFEPMWLYRSDFPKGRIIKSLKEKRELVKEGWVDHPGKCTLLPGHEHLFEGTKDDGLTITVGEKK